MVASCLEPYRRTDNQLQLAGAFLVSDTLTSPLIPGFSTPMADIFRLKAQGNQL
jgi:hypothetical protein